MSAAVAAAVGEAVRDRLRPAPSIDPRERLAEFGRACLMASRLSTSGLTAVADTIERFRPTEPPRTCDESTANELRKLAEVLRGIQALLTATATGNSNLSYSGTVLAVDGMLSGLPDKLDGLADRINA